MSHVARLLRTEGHLIHKITATDSTGRQAWYLVHVRPARERGFLAALECSGTINLEDFGRVLQSGYGRRPDEEAKARIKAELGFDLDW